MTCDDMTKIDWEHYPRVAQNPFARSLLQLEAALGNAPNTLDAYARGREDFFTFCAGLEVAPESAAKEHILLWVRDLTSRPSRHGQNSAPDSCAGLSNATVQQRITAVRLLFDFVVEKGRRDDNPIGRGRFTPRKGFYNQRDSKLLPRYRKLPWIPDDNQWRVVIQVVREEPLRNRAIFSLAYDAALRREEVCSLQIRDFDFAHRMVTVRAEVTKNRQERVIPFSDVSGQLLAAYLRHRRSVSTRSGSVFLSESHRNHASPISIWTWSKVVRHIAQRAELPGFTTHTLRHLCLTDLARSGWDVHEIAIFAGHRSLESTKSYIHLSGRDLADKFERGMAQIHQWRMAAFAEALS